MEVNQLDCAKVGKLILQLRKEKGLTQKNVADALNISNKTISKWECGMGCPDASLWSELSRILGADIQKMLEGELNPNSPDYGNIRRVKFYVCPLCGNILVSTSPASIFCCGRKLIALIPKKIKGHSLDVQVMDIDYYISFNHEMHKSHFISFVAYVADDKVLLNRLYPEQDSTVRFPIMRGNGKLYAYCNHHGLWEQSILDKYKRGQA